MVNTQVEINLSEVEIIEESAFENCESLTSINLPKNLNILGSYAFLNCSSLKNIFIPNGITEWGFETFAFSGLENITLENGITSLPNSCFAGCVNLKEITIPSSVVSINESVFDGCKSLQKVFFEGNAPATYSGENVHRLPVAKYLYTIYYHQEATGFTSPEWYGYPTQIW